MSLVNVSEWNDIFFSDSIVSITGGEKHVDLLKSHLMLKSEVKRHSDKDDIAEEKSSNENRKLDSSDRPFSCRFCEKTFTTSGNLRVHERIHTNDRPFSCRFCEKTFTTSGNLQVHERIHTNDRPFSCRFCEKTFTQSGHLQSHERTHTNDRPFSCRFCAKTFTLGRFHNQVVLRTWLREVGNFWQTVPILTSFC